MDTMIDRKFQLLAISHSSGEIYRDDEAVLFLARDMALPATLKAYHAESKKLGCDQRQLDAIEALYERVVAFQATSGFKLAAVETEREAQRLLEGSTLAMEVEGGSTRSEQKS